MLRINMPASGVNQHEQLLPQRMQTVAGPHSAVVRNAGGISRISEVFPERSPPCYARGAMQGEAVIGCFDEKHDGDNYLYSLNAETCVIATVYNRLERVGAVVHFDHNIRSQIETAWATINDAVGLRGQPCGAVNATLVGGVWFGGEDIGRPVRDALRALGVDATWQHWSYSSCMVNRYGAMLDLKDGSTTVFSHSLEAMSNFTTPLLEEASGLSPKTESTREHQRALAFMSRFRKSAIVQVPDGTLRYVNAPGSPSGQDVAEQLIRVTDLRI